MAKFKYNARTKEGEMQTGFVEAPSNDAAANILSSHDLFVLSIEGQEKRHLLDEVIKFFNRVKARDLMIFTRQFSTLLESEVPLSDAINNLYKQTRNSILKEAIYEVSEDVSSGLSISQALERQSHIFSEFYVNMVRSAEVTGRLEHAMGFLADFLEKEVMWKSKIRNAMIYPAFIIGLFLIVGLVLLVVVFPKLKVVFEESSAQLPFITKVLLGSGDFILNWWWIIILVGGFLISLLVNYLKSSEGRVVSSELIIRTPIFGDLFKKMYVARFADSVSVLIKGGVPLTQAIAITSHNIGNLIYRDILHEISERVRAGESFSSLLSANEYYFPALVGQMTAIGETTGRLEEILLKISVFYTREVDNVIDNLTELIQPILITIIGIFVGLLFAAVLVPIYNMVQGIKI